MSGAACPNCDAPDAALYTTPDLGPDMYGVTHCGCFWEGSADGKTWHVDTLPAWQLRYMADGVIEVVPCGAGEAVCS